MKMDETKGSYGDKELGSGKTERYESAGGMAKQRRGNMMHLRSHGGKHDKHANTHGHGMEHAKGGHLEGCGDICKEHGFSPGEEYQGHEGQDGGAPTEDSNTSETD